MLLAMVLGGLGRTRKPPSAAIVDDFNSTTRNAHWQSTTALLGVLDSGSWNLGGSASQPSGVLAIGSFGAENDMNGVTSDATGNNLTAGNIRAQLVSCGFNTSAYMAIQATGDNSQSILWNITNSFGTITISAQYNNAGSAGTTWSDTYSATDHAFLRIRCESGDWYWETAPDSGGGVPGTWTVRRQRSVDGGTPGSHWSPTSTTYGIYAGANNGTGASASWDNFDADLTP